MRRSLLCTAVILSSFAISERSGEAQDAILAELYGEGMHLFYSRDYSEAHSFFSEAIDGGYQDPRVYYFRGLTFLSLGRPDEATADFEKGADLETNNTDRIFPVSQSLQRVQGKARLALEKHRRRARVAARAAQARARAARYEQLKRAEEQVLRDPNRQPGAAAADLVGQPPAADASDPFGGGAAAAPATAAPAAAAGAGGGGGADPFGGGGATGADPFGGGAAPATPAAPAAADPFGGGDTGNDPFADDPAPAGGAMPAGDDPFGGGGDDPFGAAP